MVGVLDDFHAKWNAYQRLGIFWQDYVKKTKEDIIVELAREYELDIYEEAYLTKYVNSVLPN